MHTRMDDDHAGSSVLVAILYPIAILLLAYAYIVVLYHVARWLGSLI